MSIEHFWPRANPADGVDIHGSKVVMSGPHGFGHYAGNRDPWTDAPSSPAALQRKYGKTRSPVSPHSCATCLRNNPSPAACVRCLKKHNQRGTLCKGCDAELGQLAKDQAVGALHAGNRLVLDGYELGYDNNHQEFYIWSPAGRQYFKTAKSAVEKLYPHVGREALQQATKRNNPSTQSLDRSVQQDLNSLQGFIPEGHYGEAKTILTWLHKNEMDSIATYFVDSVKKGRDKFVRDFHLDKKVLGGMFSAKAGKPEVTRALQGLKAASWASVRENPVQTGTKMIVAGLTLAGIASAVLYSNRASATVVPGPQPVSNTPTSPPPETEVVITSPPAGSPPDAPPVEHVVPTNGAAPAPEPPIAAPVPPTAPSPTPAPVAGTPAHTGLVARLSTSDAARQIFVFQALAYEWMMTGALPDGLMGPVTAGLIRSVDLQSSVSPPSGNFRGATTINRLTDVIMRGGGGALPAPRVLPFTLPRSVISQVNATGTRIGSPILLQIQAA